MANSVDPDQMQHLLRVYAVLDMSVSLQSEFLWYLSKVLVKFY